MQMFDEANERIVLITAAIQKGYKMQICRLKTCIDSDREYLFRRNGTITRAERYQIREFL